MGVDVAKNCVFVDGNMYCWDEAERCYYTFTKKKAGLVDLPREAAVLLADLMCSENGG
ncbi:MAG: hypothetical protein LBU70_05240 [Chitinispirillales bacterium]|jgi:hypothetical protein|nr:hypothetical protein [Chitinispirillales bacterium]